MDAHTPNESCIGVSHCTLGTHEWPKNTESCKCDGFLKRRSSTTLHVNLVRHDNDTGEQAYKAATSDVNTQARRMQSA